jgi:hypothetical protein
MKPKSPTGRRESPQAAKRRGRLYDRLVYWLYERGDARRARPFADRLGRLLAAAGPETGAIFAEECRALVHETWGNWAKAVEHRQNEIRLIRRLRRLARKMADADAVFRQYSYADLRDRLDLLAMLEHDGGNLDKAIRILKASEKMCKKHGLDFPEEDTLREYREERRSRREDNGPLPPGAGRGRG